MEQNKSSITKKVGVLEVEGKASLMDGFFEALSETVRTIVRSELQEALAKVPAAKPATVEQVIEPVNQPRRVPGNLVDTQEIEKARAALSKPLILPDIKDGQGLIDVRVLARYLNVSCRFLYRLIAEGALPEAITLGGRSKRWALEEIMAWVFHGCPVNDRWQKIRSNAMREYRAANRERAK